MQVSIIQDLEQIGARKWDNFVKQDPGHTVFSSYSWLIALQRGLGYEPRHVLVEEGSTLIAALPCFNTN